MANAKITYGGSSFVFNIDPSEASWQYNMKVNSIDTYGGRVNQILSCNITGMRIGGYITQKGAERRQWAKMEEFETKVTQIMEWQAANKKPCFFEFPALGWSGHIYLMNYSDVRYNPTTTAVSYSLSMEVDSGFEAIAIAVSEERAALDNIQNGVNYIRSEYNYPNPDNWETVKKALEKVVEHGGEYGEESYTDLYDAMLAVEKEMQEEEKENSALENALELVGSTINNAIFEAGKAGGIYSLGDDYSEPI